MRMRLSAGDERRVLDIAIAAAVVSIAIALAGLVWRIAGHAGTGAVTVPDAAAIGTAAPPADPSASWAPFGSPAAVDATQPTGIQAELKGIIFARPTSLSTAYVAIGAEPAKPYAIGAALAGATVTDIRRDRIILNNGGRLEYLAFPDPFATPTPAPGAAPPPSGVAVPTSAPGAATGLPAQAPGAQTILSRLNATQVPGGYAVGAGAPPGMRAGDVVQSVNGAAMTDQAAVNAAVASAAQAGQAQITLLRDGRPITVTVPIR